MNIENPYVRSREPSIGHMCAVLQGSKSPEMDVMYCHKNNTESSPDGYVLKYPLWNWGLYSYWLRKRPSKEPKAPKKPEFDLNEFSDTVWIRMHDESETATLVTLVGRYAIMVGAWVYLAKRH